MLRISRTTVAQSFLALFSLVALGTAAEPAFLSVKPVARFEGVGAAQRFGEIMDFVETGRVSRLVGRERWDKLVERHRAAILQSETHEAFAAAVNALFGDAISHFHYYTEDEFSYWHARSAFGIGEDPRVGHIGLFPQKIGKRWYVRGVLEGSPAADAPIRIRVGDEIVAVEDEPYRSFTAFGEKAGQPTKVTFRRAPGVEYSVEVTPVRESLHKAVQRAIRDSITILNHDGKRMAYMHAWTLLGGREYRELKKLEDDVDGLLLDFRDGYGGTWNTAGRFLSGEGRESWTKPVVILIADGTRSAKEIVVDAVKRAGRAPLVGMPTPGHVTSVGGFRRTGADGLLMLPGFRFELEGNPIEPDLRVERPIRYCAGEDPQMDAAKRLLTLLIERAGEATNDATSPGRDAEELQPAGSHEGSVQRSANDVETSTARGLEKRTVACPLPSTIH